MKVLAGLLPSEDSEGEICLGNLPQFLVLWQSGVRGLWKHHSFCAFIFTWCSVCVCVCVCVSKFVLFL